MPTSISRRKKHTGISLKRLGIPLFLLVLTVGILITTFYTIPAIFEYLVQKQYISPLAKNIPGEVGRVIKKEDIISGIKKIGFSFEEIVEYDESYMVKTKSGEIIMFSKKISLAQQLTSLQRISSRLTIEGKHFAHIDLRFDRPVILPK